MNKFAFNETRYINSHIDYSYYQQQNIKFQKCFLDINNKLSTNKTSNNKMIGSSVNKENYKIKIIVQDSYHNTSILEFNVKVVNQNISNTERKMQKMVHANQVFEFKSKTCEIYIPNGSLYNDYPFEYNEIHDSLMKYPIYKILDDSIPSHKKFVISIDLDTLNIQLRDKVSIARIENGELYYLNSKWEKNKIIGTSNKFGEFTILIDTIKPIIEYANKIHDNCIKFNIYDELSGIKTYRAELNGQWILMEYDFKTNLLYHNFTTPEKNKKHHIKLSVTDMMNNESIINTVFFR